MAGADDPMPIAQLPDTPDVALLPADVDADPAAWLASVRAAVRRTGRRLFILFSGVQAALPPCEALLRLAAAALEVAAAEGRPQLDIVPLFPTAGWANLAAGRAPGRQQAEALRDVQVVFCAAPGAAGSPAAVSTQQSGASGAAGIPQPQTLGPGGMSDAGSPAAQQHSASWKGMRSRPAGSRTAGRKQAPAGASAAQPAGAHAAADAAQLNIAPEPPASGEQQPQAGVSIAAASADGRLGLDAGADPPEEHAAAAAGADMAAAVRLAEVLSAARPPGQPPVAVGMLSPAATTGSEAALGSGSTQPQVFGHVAVGGTFDRLHAGHRILLAASALAATEAVYIGVTGPALLKKKKHAELLEVYRTREAAAVNYVKAVRPGLAVHTGELHDAKGLAAEVEAIQALVVSQETAQGAAPINDDRAARGFPPLEVVTVSLVGASGGAAAKLSSTELRAREAAENAEVTEKAESGNSKADAR